MAHTKFNAFILSLIQSHVTTLNHFNFNSTFRDYREIITS
jgi:hypothetical protein